MKKYSTMKKTLNEEKERILKIMNRINEQNFDSYNADTSDRLSKDDVRDAFRNEIEYPYNERNKKYMDWYNYDESSFEIYGDGEHTKYIFILEIPKEEFNDDTIYEIKDVFDLSSSHGIEGNPGGMTSRGYVSVLKDTGSTIKIEIEKSYIMDV